MTRMLKALAVAGCVVAATGVACDKVQLLAPTSSTITVSAPTTVLPLGGSTQISAVVIEQVGTAVQNGTTVRFTATLGRVEPAEAQTRNGLATTMFIAGDRSGVAEVRATSGAAGGGTGTDATNAVQITIGAAATTAVVLSATPSTVPPSGGTVALLASAFDESGNRLVGIPVTFSTTAGTLSATTAATDSNGEAGVNLFTNRQATVTARAGNETGTATVNVAVPPGIAATPNPASVVAGSPVTLTVTPTIAAGSPAPRVVVSWGDDSETDLGLVASARAVAHTYSDPGVYLVTVRATADGETVSTVVVITVT